MASTGARASKDPPCVGVTVAPGGIAACLRRLNVQQVLMVHSLVAIGARKGCKLYNPMSVRYAMDDVSWRIGPHCSSKHRLPRACAISQMLGCMQRLSRQQDAPSVAVAVPSLFSAASTESSSSSSVVFSHSPGISGRMGSGELRNRRDLMLHGFSTRPETLCEFCASSSTTTTTSSSRTGLSVRKRDHNDMQAGFLQLYAHFEVSSMRSAASVGDCITREAAISRLCAAAAADVMGCAWPMPPAEQLQRW